MKRTNLSFTKAIIAIAIIALIASSSYAGVAANIMRTSDDQLVIAEGVCNNADLYVKYPTQVLAWTFDGSASSIFYSQNHPAITAADAEAGDSLYSSAFQFLPANTAVHFAFDAFNASGTLTNLAYWDGTGEVNFAPVSNGATLSIEQTTIDGSPLDVDGFDIATTSSGGGIHAHPYHKLENGGTAPDQGVYLWCMEISMPGMNTSDPYFVVMNTYDISAAAVDTAEAWVAGNANVLLATDVPEPSCWLLLCSACLGIVGLRRKRN